MAAASDQILDSSVSNPNATWKAPWDPQAQTTPGHSFEQYQSHPSAYQQWMKATIPNINNNTQDNNIHITRQYKLHGLHLQAVRPRRAASQAPFPLPVLAGGAAGARRRLGHRGRAAERCSIRPRSTKVSSIKNLIVPTDSKYQRIKSTKHPQDF